MAVTLYGEPYWYSPYVFTAFVALKEKGVAFETKLVSIDTGEHKSEAFAPSITGRVPALEHDGFWLAESSAIAEYVDEAFPGPRLFPGGARERARARQLMAFVRSDLMPLREERSTETMFYARATKPLSAAGQAAADKLVQVASRVVKGTQLFETWSIADADLAFMLHRLILNGHEIPAQLRAFAEANWSRPSVHAFVSHDRPAKK
ncbi:MAG: glutathione transferase [Polyangiales bacterium]